MPGGAAELVGADRQQVGPEGAEVDRHPPDGLGGVDVDEHAPLAAAGRPPRRPAGRCRPRGCPTGRGRARCRAGSRRAARRGRPGRPPSTRRPSTAPAARGRPRTAECSTAGTTWCRPRARPRRGTRSAMASVAPLVNTTSRDRAPSSAATCSRASSTATRAAMPSAWMRPGSPRAASSQRDHRVARLGPQRRRGRVVEVVAGQQFARRRSPAPSRGPRRCSSAWSWSAIAGEVVDRRRPRSTCAASARRRRSRPAAAAS